MAARAPLGRGRAAAARALARSAAAHPTRPLDLVLLRRTGPAADSGFFVLRDDEPMSLEAYLEAWPRPELLAFAERLGWLTDGPRGTMPVTSFS